MKPILTVLLVLVLAQVTFSERILVLTPLGSKSHKNVFDPLIHALASKGHKLTTAVPSKSGSLHPNVKEFVPQSATKFADIMPNPFDARRAGRMAAINFNMSKIIEVCEDIYQEQEFREIIKGPYDLVIMNGFINNCFDCVVHKLNVPHILITAQGAPNVITELFGNHLPLSFVPNAMLPLSHRMNFWERLLNFGTDHLMKGLGKWMWLGPSDSVNRKYMGEDCPGYHVIQRNASLLLMNNHFTLTYPRPNLPDNVEVGGMHCRPAKPLPKELNEYLSEAEHGFIYFSLGSIVQAQDMPKDTRNAFLKVFSKLKQRVIWKWEGEMDDLPPNVRIQKWLPQQNILGHKNIRAFITHGGLLSTQEAIYHGVPLLGLPLFADQDLNMKQAEARGYALMAEIVDLDEHDLETKLNRLLNEPSFSEKAKELSAVFRDQTETPLERAVFWVEYVLRHGGATHLRSAGRDLNYFQLHSYDVLGFLLAVFSSIILVAIWSCKFLCRRMCGKKEAKQIVKSSKKRN